MSNYARPMLAAFALLAIAISLAGGVGLSELFASSWAAWQGLSMASAPILLAGCGLVIVAFACFLIRQQRDLGTLQIEALANRLMLDTLEKTRTAIVIFNRDRKAVHWNCGLNEAFSALMPLLRQGATLSEVCTFAYRRQIFASDMDCDEIDASVAAMVRQPEDGIALHQLVHTSTGNTFEFHTVCLGRGHFGAIWVDVTRMQRRQEQIAAQSRELERANRLLTEFSTIVAHDLKAPLRQQMTLAGYIREDIWRAGLRLPEETSRALESFDALTRRMSLLVDDLMAYAQTSPDHALPECFKPDKRLGETVRLAAIPSGIDVTLMPDMPAVQVNPKSFDLVMRNLITNAAKHHDKGTGHITVRAYLEKTDVVIEVEDDGPGIPLAQHNRVFEPFARLTQVEGSGLGLALARKAAEAWGGGIQLRAAPKRGCVFSVRLPAAEFRHYNTEMIAITV